MGSVKTSKSQSNSPPVGLLVWKKGTEGVLCADGCKQRTGSVRQVQHKAGLRGSSVHLGAKVQNVVVQVDADDSLQAFVTKAAAKHT